MRSTYRDVRSKQGILFNKEKKVAGVLWQATAAGTVFGFDVFTLESDIVLKRRIASFWDFSRGRAELVDDRSTYHVFVGDLGRYPESYSKLPDIIHVGENESYRNPDRLGHGLVNVFDLDKIKADRAYSKDIQLKDMSSDRRFAQSSFGAEIPKFAFNIMDYNYRYNTRL